MRFFSLVSFLLLLSGIAVANDTRHIDVHREGVLGTSLDISVYISSNVSTLAEQSIDAAITAIADLEAHLSGYKDDSEVSRLNQEGRLSKPSLALNEVLQACEYWRGKSAGKFSCNLGSINTIWASATKSQTVPDRVALRKLARSIIRAGFPLLEQGANIILPNKVQIDVDGLAKGYIIDKAFTLLKQRLPTAIGIKVDIGGDARYWGHPTGANVWQVGLADPNNVADNKMIPSSVLLANKAIAASGHDARYFDIEHRRFSHILDPAEGWPLFHAPAAIVIADSAIQADAIATALSTQEINDGIDWVNSLDKVEALVISPKGLRLASKNWHWYVGGRSRTGRKNSPQRLPFQLRLDYTIPKLNADEYNRPYVAIWISDKNNKPVRNLLLLGESERWARENSRWWRRVGRRNPELLDGLARSTRRPGEYTVTWNGLSDFGENMSTGEYTLHIEAAREHGGHNYKKLKLALFKRPFDLQLERTEGELGAVKISYK